jgi:hypothetical protein
MDNSTQGWWLDASGLALVLLIVTALDRCWLRRLLVSCLRVIYRKYTSMRHQHNCNVWDAKSDMMHDYAQLTHTNTYKPLTSLPLAFLVFSQFNFWLRNLITYTIFI